MRKLLTTLLLLPVLAAAQIPIEPDAPTPGARPAPAPRARPLPPGVAPQDDQAAPATPPATAPAAPAPAPAAPAARGGGTAKTQPATRADRCVPLQGRFMLSFNKADVVDVLEQASRWTCRNFIYTDEIARGKITLLSKTPVTADEAYAAFLAALSANNIAVYPTGKYYKLIRTADAKKFPIPTYTGDASGTPAVEQPITKVVKLRSADADQLRGILGNFISPQGADIQAIPPDTLVITDIGLNIRRIERMIEAIDKAGAGDMVRLVQIRYAPAKEVADKINQIFAGSGGAAGAAAVRPGTRRAVVSATPRTLPGAAGATAGGRAESVSVTKVIADDRTNKLIVVADDKSFQRIQELIDQLDVPTSADGGIHVVFLKNANAEELAQTLSNLAQGIASSRRTGTSGASGANAPGLQNLGGMQGFQPPATTTPATPASTAPGAATAQILGDVKITADKQQNALIVQASGSDFAAVQRLVEKLDRPRRQVFVEAVIMEVNLRNDNEFGVGAHGLVDVSVNGKKGVLPLSSNLGRVSSFDLSSVVSLGGFLTGFTGPTSGTLKDLTGVELPSLGVLVQALQSNSDVNVLSTPHLVASDNEESEITVGQNVPFQAGYTPANLSSLLGGTSTSTTNTSISSLSSLVAPIQRQNVELSLKIKPQISEGDTVRLTVEEKTEEIASTDQTLGPTTSKRSVKTQIITKDQGTIVIGGLIQERATRSVKKIPLLGSLPVLGYLFRDTQTSKQKTNLLLFLTPYIIRDESDYRRLYEKKRKEYQDFVEQFYGRQPAYRVDVDFARKAGPYARLHRGVQEETLRLENGGPGTPGQRLSLPPSSQPFGGPAPSEGNEAPEGATPGAATPDLGTPAAPEGEPSPETPPTQPPAQEE